nr:MAG TPA: Neck appendage protein [Caudoviricetes sp.]
MGKTLGYGEITVANMTEPFTVMLTNEAQQFATDSNRKVTSAQSYYTDIIVIRGSQERTDYTIGNITSGSGITVSKNSKRVTFSVSAGTTIGADAGVIEIPITLDGQTVKKQFSWSCGKQGPQGVKGNDGNSFAWNMLSETNCGKKHWGTESSGGKYSVEDFITEDNIDAVKLICTEAISTSNWSFVSFKDIKMLKQLKPSTKYTLSYDIKANRSGAISHSICKGDVSNFCTNTVVVNNIIGNETWQHISVVLTTNDLKTTPTNEILYLGRNALSKVGYSIIKNLKLVEGDIDTPWSPSQSDIEGKGVVETVQYYLATSQASGVTSSTSGWSTDITTQKLTADKKYLWNCYQTKYSDGTSEPISTPKVIGVYGDKGQKGENAKNLSITPSSQYFKSTDGGKTFAPDTIAIKPTIQGEISFGKWQYSIDGGVSFADVVSGQKGLTISNNVLTVNKDSSLYSDAVTMVTFRAVANDSSFYDTCSIAKIYDVSDIGDGRNLIQKSQLNPIDGAELSLDDYTKNGTVIFTNKSENSGFSFDSYNNYQPNSKYVLSYYFTKTSGTMNSFGGSHNGKGVVYTSFFVDDKVYDTASYAGGSSQIGTILNDGKRHRIVVCYTTPDTIATDTSVNYTFIQPGRGNTNPNFGVKIEELKLEKGSSPTGWSPAPEDLQTAILSTKSEISDVSLKVDKNKQAIEQRVEKNTYQQDLTLVKGDISKANEGLNKWRYEIYPKSLFTDKPEDQRKISLDVFARNKNIIPTQSILLDDTKLGYFNYDDNYIGYAVTFVKMSEATKLETTFVHDDAGSFYLNGKLICTNGTNNFYSSATPDTVSCTLVKGWNCLEVVINEGAGSEGFKFGTVLSHLSTCQLMNCYYAMVTGRESQITNTLVQNTIDIEGVSTKVGKVTSIIGENGENFTDFKNDYSDFKQTMNGFKTTVGQTYVTKDDFNGLEIGGRNLLLYSQTIKAHNNYYGVSYLIDEVETFNGCPVWSVKNQWGRLAWSFKSHVIDRGLVKVGDTLTYSLYAKTNNTSGKRIACSYRFKGNAQAYWFEGSAFNIGTSWARYSATFTVTKDMLTTDTYMNEIGFEETASMSGDDKVYFACPKLERGTKATDYTEAPEDNEVNGQNLVSNLPANWEQGSFVVEDDSKNKTYSEVKVSEKTQIRIKELIPVFGDITISAQATQNSSKEALNHYVMLFDVNKRYMGKHNVNGWNASFPRIFNCGDAKYIAIALKWGDGTKTQITPSDISKICLKIERGTSATPFTLAPEDINGKIVNVETIANQTADKFSWIVKSGTSSSNFEITDRLMNLVSANINLDGIVSFMNTAKGDGRKNLYNLDYSSFENVASQEDAICYAKDNGVTSVGIDSSVSYDGDKSLKISYTTANLNSSTTPLYLGSSANNYGCVKIQAGKQYILSCYVKSDSTTGLFMIDIQGHDTPDTKTDGLYLSNIDPRKLPGSSTGVNLSTDWQRAVCAIKVADNATGLYWSVVPLIWGRPSSSSAPQTFNVWVDCIMLEEVDSISNEPGTYILDKETIIDGGSIKTNSIASNQILANSITADKIATDAIKSRNYISSGCTQGSFLNLSDGSFTSPNLSWDSNGNLIAKNANLSGEITATNGSIAGWTIISNKMYTTGSGKYTGIGKYGSAYAFWAGATSNDNGNSAVFKVGHTGKLTATDADITGTITATNGKIGRYDITSTYLMTNSGSNASGIGGNQAFWAGAEDSNSAPFRVGYDGVLWAENAAIRGSIETGNLGDEGDTVSIINGHIGIQGTSNNVEIYSTGFKFGIDGDYYLMSVSEGVKCYRNLYATDFVADGWLYCSEVHSSGAVVIGADSESFYWAHGYQIARGTSWGGVCVGDDSQQLRLYGSSIWASHSISTSDENLKENFTTLDQYENFYMNLNPIGFNYIGDYDGKKTHFGFGAHKTEDVLESEGYDADKFAVVTHRPLVQEDIEKRFGKDVEVDIETEYGVSYTEFIALNTHMIQKTRRELTKVKQEKADLEVRLQAIEVKLGL